MGTIDAKEFIDELIFCLDQEDIVKAKALLQFASDSNVGVDVQKRALGELAKGSDRVVFPLLEYLTKVDMSDPEIQDRIYELILDKSFGNTDLVAEYIHAPEKVTRLAFIRAAGELVLTDTAVPLLDILSNESDPEILIAATNALEQIRAPQSLGALSQLASHSDPGVRKAAVFAVAAHSGEQTVDILKGFLGEDEDLNKLVAEALAGMQSHYALTTLTSLLSSNITNIRDTAIDQLIQLGTKATPLLTRAFQNAEADYLVHLITTLGYIADPAAIHPILDIVNTQPKDPNIRQAAYEAMERIPSPKTAICLAQGLQDPIEAVRMSAARAVDKNLSKPLVAGLKNIIRHGDDNAKLTVSSLIDTEATNIFNFLVDEDAFQEIASQHIITGASPSTRKFFLKQMISIGKKEFATQIAKEVSENGKEKNKVCRIIVVDDSKMMLKLYQNKLSTLGFEAIVFHRPEKAIPHILTQKPDLVITDLNMPNISGLELTREIRKKFTRQELPILMITTQSDFVEDKSGDIDVNDTILKKSGINKILHKPFTDKSFRGAVTQLIEH